MKMYCRSCEDLTSHRQKGLRPPVNVCNVCSCTNSNYMLLKSNGEMHRSDQVKFVEFESVELGSRGKKLHDFPKPGFSVILDPQWAPNYTWLTTPIVEIVEMKEDYLKFNTQNSSYELFGTIALYEEAQGDPI